MPKPKETGTGKIDEAANRPDVPAPAPLAIPSVPAAPISIPAVPGTPD
jgi:hypothetical protein